VQRCPSCGEENPDRFRLCGFCGTSLTPEAPPEENRRTVTVVFSDLKGSTSLGERLDSEALRQVLSIYFSAMRDALERHGGTVEKYIGDAVMAVFGLPRLHEDDAIRAVRAAVDMREELVRVNERLEAEFGVRLDNRTGVYTGEVVAGDVTTGQRLVTGDTVNVAARLEQAAPASEVLIGLPTYELVRDAVEVEEVEPLELKGKAERVPAFRLIRATAAEGRARRLDLPLVGRELELDALNGALSEAGRERRARLVTVLGSAGAGKSRLIRGFVDDRRDEVRAVVGRCLSYGEGITYWPIAEIARAAAGIGEDEPVAIARAKLTELFANPDAAVRVASAIGMSDTPFPSEELFWGIRKLFESLAAERPLVAIVDDIHWAETTLLDLLRNLVESVEAPVLFLCSSRKELLEEHADWPTGGEYARAIELAPLSAVESAEIVTNLLGTTGIDPVVVDRIAGAAEGNPLFVEQLLSMLVEDGTLRQEDGRWVAAGPLDAVEIPPTIAALLSARLDRLGPTERTVIERGAVIGQNFYRGAVEEMSPEAIRPHVVRCLVSLEAKELISEMDTAFLGLATFRFVHILVRDAAYHGILKRTRADLHEAFVDWIEHAAPDRASEYEEIRGFHLEQAYLIRVQLGTIDERLEMLGRRASEYLGSSGRHAVARGDMPAAAGLLRRAAGLLPADDRDRVELFVEAGEALIETGELRFADDMLRAAITGAELIADEALILETRAARFRLQLETEGTAEEDVVREVGSFIPALERLEAHAGLARAWRVLTQIHWQAARYGEAEQATWKMIEHAKLAGDALLAKRASSNVAMCLLYGPTPVDEAIDRCRGLMDETAGDRKAEALVLCVMARLHAMRGEFDVAREHYRRSRAMLEEFGWHLLASLTSLDSGPIELLAGDPTAAEAELRPDHEALERMGERNYLATTAAYLAESLYVQGRLGDAERYATESAEVAAPDDVASQMLWREVAAKIHARKDHHEQADVLARQAVELARTSDDPDAVGTALADLAEVWMLGGRPGDAEKALREALGLFDSKGSVVSAGRTRALLAEIGVGDDGAETVPATR
jgi:class 3 adenylate cyclase/tetratricopeptide (TPR) repeat protein